MKLNIGIFAIAVLFSVSISAQRFHGGLLGGINASQIDGDNWDGYHKAGLNFGAFVNTDLKDKWSAQLEIKYSAKGSSNSSPDDLKMISLRYIDIPVLATYQAMDKLKIQAGVSFNYLFSSMLYEGDWYPFDEKCNPVESAIAIGINYNLLNNIDVNARYNYSIMPIHSRYSTSSWGDGAWFNNVLSFSVYYNIGL
jgi:opacity protein-like surface antigen